MIQSVWKNLTGLQKAAEHLWCDFKWATNSSPNTNDLYICVVISYTSKLLQQRWKYIFFIMFPSLLAQFGSGFFSSKEECQYFCPYNECKVTGVWWWVFGSSSSTLTQSSFLFDLKSTEMHIHVYNDILIFYINIFNRYTLHILYMCCIYIHNTYTQYTHIYVNKNFYFGCD